MSDIAEALQCSVHKVAYWIDKHKIPTRSMSEALYAKYNPGGDPFSFRRPRTVQEGELYGLGLGLFWGEGTKSNKHAIRLGNTDPKLIKTFIRFLETFFAIQPADLKFGLQVFSDVSKQKALEFWLKELKVSKSQFQKVIVTKSGSVGTYRYKNQYGVLQVHYNNVKARKKLEEIMPA